MSQENNFIPSQESYKNLRPFPLFMKTNFPFIENTFESLDVYGLLCKVVEYLNNVIENENIVTDNQQAVYNAFVQLNDYVSHYFDNLDVQEEINNKLDEMAESGELLDIITEYLNTKAIFTYDTLDDMKNGTLQNGSYAQTLGRNEVNDRGGGIYKIVESEPSTYYETLDNGLYAVLIVQNVLNLKTLNNNLQTAFDDFNNIEINSNEKITDVIEIELPHNKKLKLNNLDLEGSESNSMIFSTSLSDGQQNRILSVTNSNFKTYSVLQFGYSKELSVDNCSFTNAVGESVGSGYGLIIGNTLNASVNNSKFTNNQRHALYAGMVDNLVVTNNIFEKHRYGLSTSGFNSALNIARGTKNAIITNNKFIDNNTLDINISSDNESSRTKIENVIIANNEFINTTGRNIKIGQSGTVTDDITIGTCIIENNIFDKESTQESILVYNCDRLIIRNNIFNFRGTGNVITLNNIDDKLKEIVIENNTFNGNYTNAIYIGNNVLQGTTKINIRNNNYIKSKEYCFFQSINNATNTNMLIDAEKQVTLSEESTDTAITLNTRGLSLISLKGVGNINNFNSQTDDIYVQPAGVSILFTASANLVLYSQTITLNKIYHFKRYGNVWYEI